MRTTIADRIKANVKRAHDLNQKHMDTHFSLGSAFDHCKRLKGWAGLLVRAAMKARLVGLNMPSEYHSPYLTIEKSDEEINASLPVLREKLAELREWEAKVLAEIRRSREAFEATHVDEGKRVIVVAGRKFKKGRTGKVVAIRKDGFARRLAKVIFDDIPGRFDFGWIDTGNLSPIKA